MPDSKTEAGPTWTGYFPKGKIGIQPMPATLPGLANATSPTPTSASPPSRASTAASPPSSAATPSASRRTARSPTQAWNFLSWLESDDAQVEVVAKGGNVVSRTDLANNKYSSADPRLVLFNTIAGKGQTPFALNFGQTYNDPQGPWLVLLRTPSSATPSKIDADNDAINASLQP